MELKGTCLQLFVVLQETKKIAIIYTVFSPEIHFLVASLLQFILLS